MSESATEILRRMLDERGARYEKSEDDTTIYYDGDGNRYTYNVNPDSGWAQLFGYNLTPEQAIAATLGGEREKALESMLEAARDDHRRFIDNMNEMIEEEVRERLYESSELTALTAEQVGEAIERNFGKICVLDDGKPVEWRDEWVCRVGIDYKAIADELNAVLSGGECEVIQSDNGPKCSNCGKELPEDPYSDYEGNFCPTCGARIRKAVKR